MPSRATIEEIDIREIETAIKKFIREWQVRPTKPQLLEHVVHMFSREGWTFGAFRESVLLNETILKAYLSQHWEQSEGLPPEQRTSQYVHRFVAEKLYADGFHRATT